VGLKILVSLRRPSPYYSGTKSGTLFAARCDHKKYTMQFTPSFYSPLFIFALKLSIKWAAKCCVCRKHVFHTDGSRYECLSDLRFLKVLNVKNFYFVESLSGCSNSELRKHLCALCCYTDMKCGHVTTSAGSRKKWRWLLAQFYVVLSVFCWQLWDVCWTHWRRGVRFTSQVGRNEYPMFLKHEAWQCTVTSSAKQRAVCSH
jgi:hypothetical protein